MAVWLTPIRRIARKTLERLGVPIPTRPYMGDYLQPPFVRALRRVKVQSIFEFGCGDGEDTLRLRNRFGAVVHAFECNPFMLPLLRARLGGQPGVRLIERAVWDEDGRIPFYPVVHTVQAGRVLSNPGASSCFRAVSGYLQEYVQTEVTVEAIRLDSYCDRERVRPPDLLCIDVQGAALRALRGLGRHLDGVRAIIIEIEHREIFTGEDLYPAVDGFLLQAGFHQAVVIEHDGWYNNYLYLRRATHLSYTRATERPNALL
jgi:FkbM family methyltransferase